MDDTERNKIIDIWAKKNNFNYNCYKCAIQELKNELNK